MYANDLLQRCLEMDVLLRADGENLAYDGPSRAMTESLLDDLRRFKPEILRILWAEADDLGIDRSNAHTVWQAALDRLDGNPSFPPEVMESLRLAKVRWASDATECDPATEPVPKPLGPNGWPEGCIDPPDPCPECGTLELWQSRAHHWRCLRCDPPHSLNRRRDPE